jgi:hypothetical protein
VTDRLHRHATTNRCPPPCYRIGVLPKAVYLYGPGQLCAQTLCLREQTDADLNEAAEVCRSEEACASHGQRFCDGVPLWLHGSPADRRLES